MLAVYNCREDEDCCIIKVSQVDNRGCVDEREEQGGLDDEYYFIERVYGIKGIHT